MNDLFRPCRDFAAIDLETTGLDLERDAIIEIALSHFSDGKIVKQHSTLVNPGRQLTPFIHKLTGISNEDLENAPAFEEVGELFLDWLGDLPLVAHNATIDMHFLQRHLQVIKLPVPSNPVFDSLLISRIAWPTVPNHRLETLIKELNIRVDSSHRALPDAEACGKLFLLAQEKLQTYSPKTLENLGWAARETPWAALLTARNPESFRDLELSVSKKISVEAGEYIGNENWQDIFSEGGALSKTISDWRQRSGQAELATSVWKALREDKIFLAEAGTGTGKTLAYLLPVVLHVSEKKERVLISTGTRLLQEQVWKKDLPLALATTGSRASVALLKGRSNYICLRKYQEHLEHGEKLLPPGERQDFLTLIPWVSGTADGDIASNAGFNPGRHKQLWSRVASETSSCMGKICQFYERCFALEARRKAAAAEVVIVNHALFFADMKADFSLLPAYDHVILDEAHKLPELAQRSLGRSVWFYRLRNILSTLSHPKHRERGSLARAEKLADFEWDRLREATARTEKRLHRLFSKLGRQCGKKKTGEAHFRYREALDILLGCKADEFLSELRNLTNLLEEACIELSKKNDIRVVGLARDLGGRRLSLEEFTRDFEHLFQAKNESWHYWIEEAGNPHTLRMEGVPIHAGEELVKNFWPWLRGAVLLSGTLAYKGDFDYFEKRMGLKGLSEKRVQKEIYETPYDLDKQMKVVVGKMLPSPQDRNFDNALAKLLAETLPEIRRSTLVLFTSIHSLRACHAALAPLFEKQERTLLAQHVDGGFDNLLDLYRKEKHACLLGTGTFWEGIDLPGKQLELLVIPRLPFPSPAIPLSAIATDAVREAGGNPFREYILPETVLSLRQGIGRLIRSVDDHGKLLLLDRRILSEGYGKVVARCWNSRHDVVTNAESILQFFAEEGPKQGEQT